MKFTLEISLLDFSSPLNILQESPLFKASWSESMSQLMRKLDRLNLDIEEALSASSSPSGTPCTIRKKQVSVKEGQLAPN